MTVQEAIKAIEDNKPTHGYTILCEALDMAIEALKKQNSGMIVKHFKRELVSENSNEYLYEIL